MTHTEAFAIVSNDVDYTATPAQYAAALAQLRADGTPVDSIGFVDSATYAQGYAAAHPSAPAGPSNTWLWVGAAIGVWWLFFRRRR